MKRWLFFFALLAAMFVVSFALSIWLFPSWLYQPAWFLKLSFAIGIAGIAVIGSALLQQILSFLFEDKDYQERLLFITGNKYAAISKRLDEFTRQEIDKEKRSRKYIPNIFVETTEIKEKLRYFSEPFIFFPKIVEQTDRELRASYIVNVLKQVHFPIDESVYQQKRLKPRNQESLKDSIQKYKAYLDQKLTLTDVLIKENGAGIKPEYRSQIPTEYSHIHDYSYPNLQYYWRYEYEIEQTKKDIDLLGNNVVIVKSLAGHGKTNLLCDFTENFFLKKEHKSLYISARALDHLGEHETIEQAIARTIFTEPDFQFADILRLVKFDKKLHPLFILIDGINEHKNSALFSAALEQFIQRCNGNDIKIMLTCRSEYFDDRFGNLLNTENCSVLDMDERKYVNIIPDVHIEALLTRYFSEFNVKITVDNIDPDIRGIFNEDKLLLRIFCEAYENEQPAEYLADLYKLEIFNKYYEKKIKTIQGLDECLAEIIIKMITDNQFTNVEISSLTVDSAKVVQNTVYENVIIKKDVIASPGLAFGRTEVINFVYDEFRDFLIASKVIREWDENNQASIEMMQNLGSSQSPVAEGLQRYLCLWSIKNKKSDLLKHLSSQEWFDAIFIDSAFDTPDSLLSSFVIDLVEQLFRANATNSLDIIWQLLGRANTEIYPNLNIELLFHSLAEFGEAEYEKIIVGPLSKEYDFKTSHIAHLCHIVVQAFKEKRVSAASQKNIIKLLGYFARIVDYKYPHDREYELGKHPAFEALLIIADEVGDILMKDSLGEVIANSKVESIKSPLYSILETIGEE
jgi:hypothetical protein